MRAEAFRAWLDRQSYTGNSIATRCSYAKKVEDAYGDLDQRYADGSLESLLDTLRYSKSDEKAGKENPTNIPTGGNPYNVLNSCKTSVRNYLQFCSECESPSFPEDVTIELGELLKDKKEGRQFELERLLQEVLRAEIAQVEAELTIIDGGVERSVESGNIDILAQDAGGALVVIELKRGLAKRDAVGQILGYMGDLGSEEPGSDIRGILVAADFDRSCRSARSIVPGLVLLRYRYAFRFEQVE